MKSNACVAAFLVAFGVVSLAGCAGEASSEQAGSEAEQVAGVAPGQFRLFDEPNHVTDPECESFTDLELKANGKADLVDGLGGRCALTALIDPNPRSYTLRVKDGECGAKIYEGSRRVAVGPATTGLARITITDYRVQTCDVSPPALVVIKESAGGRETTRFSKDKSQDKKEREVIVCREPVDHGAAVHFFATGEGREQTIVRAEYTETSFFDTQVVSNMNVCTKFPVGPNADEVVKTNACNDVSWVNGYTVELYEGGFAGTASIRLYQQDPVAQDGQRLVKSLNCHYESER
jgi:hypothetical protein